MHAGSEICVCVTGKYSASVFKGHVAINFWGGIIGYTGPHSGVDHDKTIWDATRHLFPTLPGEWGLGDLAYEACERLYTGRKHPIAGGQAMPWTQLDEFERNLISHYRARIETVIHRIKSHDWCGRIFRGSYEVLSALYNITMLGTALEIKNEFLIDNKVMFEVVGPWRHKFTL